MCHCMLCGHNAKIISDQYFTVYNCSVCGIYSIPNNYFTEKFLPYFNTKDENLNKNEFINHYSAYLFYNRKSIEDFKEKRRFLIGDKDSADLIKQKENIEYELLTDDIINNFYPDTIKQIENLILSKIYKDRDKSNQTAVYTVPEAESLFFIKRDYISPKIIAASEEAYEQVNEFLDRLNQKGFIEYSETIVPFSDDIKIKMTLKGREAIENYSEKETPQKIQQIYYINGVLINGSNITDSKIFNQQKENKIEDSIQSKLEEKKIQHDISSLNNILSSIPKNFENHLEHRLLENRQYKIDEFDYIFNLEQIIKNNDNFIIDEELRSFVDQMNLAFIKLSTTINSRFARARKDPNLIVLDRPLPNDNVYRPAYEKYLQEELPQAITNAVDAYNNLCHKKLEIYGE